MVPALPARPHRDPRTPFAAAPQGVKSCKRVGFNAAAYIFIAAPSVEHLKARLLSRGSETEMSLSTRLLTAETELKAAPELEWDGWIVNDDLDAAYAQLKKLVGPQ